MPKKAGAPGRPFVKGDKRAGRPKGVPNKATQEIREASRAFLDDEQGKAALLKQYQQGKLPPAVLQMLHHYAYGKPKDTVEIHGDAGGPLRTIVRVIVDPKVENNGGPEDAIV